MSEEMSELIAKVHDDIEGRYTLDSYDKGLIHNTLCELAQIKGQPNQNELWDEVENEFKYPKTVFRTSDLTTITSAKENLKKRYRITRVK